MTVDVLISVDEGAAPQIAPDEVESICGLVLAAEGVERDVEVSVSFVSDEEMRALNRDWRGIDRVTDVLSFECDSPFDGSAGTVELGDVIIAPGQIARQAPGFGSDPADECRLMLVHGLLHLLGYDHIQDGDAEVMEGREDSLLRELALARGDDPDALAHVLTTRHVDD